MDLSRYSERRRVRFAAAVAEMRGALCTDPTPTQGGIAMVADERFGSRASCAGRDGRTDIAMQWLPCPVMRPTRVDEPFRCIERERPVDPSRVLNIHVFKPGRDIGAGRVGEKVTDRAELDCSIAPFP